MSVQDIELNNSTSTAADNSNDLKSTSTSNTSEQVLVKPTTTTLDDDSISNAQPTPGVETTAASVDENPSVTNGNGASKPDDSSLSAAPISPPVPSPVPQPREASVPPPPVEASAGSEPSIDEAAANDNLFGEDDSKDDVEMGNTADQSAVSDNKSEKHELENADTSEAKRFKVDPEQQNLDDLHSDPPASATPATSIVDEPMASSPASAPPAAKIEQPDQSQQQPSQLSSPAPASAAASTDLKSLDVPAGSPPGLPKHQLKAAQAIMRSVKRLKDAAPFVHPVDAVKLNVPTYYEVITNPMDLSKMEKKLNAGEYDTARDFIADLDLVVANCIKFNGDESIITNMARALKVSFDKHIQSFPPYEAPLPPPPKQKKKVSAPPAMPKSKRASAVHANAAVTHQIPAVSAGSVSPNTVAPNSSVSSSTAAAAVSKPPLAPNGLPQIRRESVAGSRPKREIHAPKPKDSIYGDLRPRKKKFAAELKFAGQVLRELQSKKHEAYSYPFLQPVDPIALNCPTYPKIIKHPMDVSTAQQKLQDGKYENADEFVADVKLIFENCYKFNPEGSPVNMMGHRLEAVFDKKWLEKPVPAPTPPPMDYSDEEDSDLDNETLQTIKFLEEQISIMQGRIADIKKSALAKKREKRRGRKDSVAGKRKSVAGGGRRGSGAREAAGSNLITDPSQLTYEMKQELSDKISSGELSTNQVDRVVEIIKESMPQLGESDEIELDINELEPAVVLKLYNFVVKKADPSPKKKSRASTTGNAKTKKKNKPLTEEEQSRQIEQLQNQLQMYDAQNGHAGGGAGGDSDSSDDDDDGPTIPGFGNGNESSDESSEEE